MVRLLFSVDCKESLRVFPHELITWFVNAYIYDCIYMYMYICMILSRSEERRRNCIFSERCTCMQYKILLFMDGIPLIPQNGFNFLPHSDILTTINITRIHSNTLRICSSTQIPLAPAACAPASIQKLVNTTKIRTFPIQCFFLLWSLFTVLLYAIEQVGITRHDIFQMA